PPPAAAACGTPPRRRACGCPPGATRSAWARPASPADRSRSPRGLDRAAAAPPCAREDRRCPGSAPSCGAPLLDQAADPGLHLLDVAADRVVVFRAGAFEVHRLAVMHREL